MALVFFAAFGLLLWLIWDRGPRRDAAMTTPGNGGVERGTDGRWDLAYIIPMLLIAGVPLTSGDRHSPRPVALKLTHIESTGSLTVGDDRNRHDLFVPLYPGAGDEAGSATPYVAVADGAVTLTARGGRDAAAMEIAITTGDGRSCRLHAANRCSWDAARNGVARVRLSNAPMTIALVRAERVDGCAGAGDWRAAVLGLLPIGADASLTGCDDARKIQSTERRSFTLARGSEGGVMLKLDSPQAADGGTCEQPNRILMPWRDGEESGAVGSGFAFASLGAAIGSTHGLPECGSASGGAGGRIALAAARIGSSDAITLKLTRDVAGVDSNAVALFVAIILFAMVVARIVPNRPVFLAIAEPLLLSLLAVRALAAMAATYLSPGLAIIPSVPELMADALLTTMALRLILWPELRRDAVIVAAHIVFAAIILTVAELLAGDIRGRWQTGAACVALIATIWAVARAADLVNAEPEGGRLAMLRAKAVAALSSWGASACLAAASILAVIWFFFKERFLGLSTASLSLILAVVSAGLLLATLRRDAPMRSAALVLAAFVALLAAGPVLGRDSGFVLVAIGPILGSIAWAWSRQTGQAMRQRLRIAAPLLAVLPIAAITLYAVALTQSVPTGDRASLPARIAIASEISENEARLIGYIAPARLEIVSNDAAFTQLEQQALLDQITRGNWLGQGYLTPASLGNLNDFQLNDNLAAVHIHWPFGRLGLLILLAVTLLFAVAARPAPLAADASLGRRWIDASATIAGWLLPGITAYMALANLGLAPFTGRNMILLSPGSTSDLLEALLLFAVIGLGAQRADA